MTEIITSLISALLGGGIVSSVLTLYVQKVFNDAEAKRKREIDDAKRKQDAELRARQARYVIEDECEHAIGRALFWLKKGCEQFERDSQKGYWNGDLVKAYEQLDEAERRKKELDREQLAEINEAK